MKAKQKTNDAIAKANIIKGFNNKANNIIKLNEIKVNLPNA